MGILEQLDGDDRTLVVEVLSRHAPDLLAALQQGVTLTPGPRTRLEDVLLEEAVLEWVKNEGPTARADAIEALVRTLEQIQPRQPERLVTGKPWKRGDPITRGMDRYREIDGPDADGEPTTPQA
jgi:hypothetical protein